MKKVLIILIGVVVALCALLGFAGNYTLEMAVHPDDNKGRDYDRILAGTYEKYPEMKEWQDTLREKGLWRDTVLVAPDGLKRHAWIIEHDSLATGSTVVVHGYTDNGPVMMRYAYLHYQDLGRNVVVPELYGHGKSEGDVIRFGWLDRLDLTQIWLPFTHELWPDLKMVQHGLSMGAATTMFTSGEEIPDSLNLVAFIEDCGYSSTWDQLYYNMSQLAGNAVASIILPVSNIICKMKYGWDMKVSSATSQLAKCKRPMLFIHGEADDFVPFSMLQKNYDAKTTGYKEMLTVPGANHAESIHNEYPTYLEKVKSYLSKVE